MKNIMALQIFNLIYQEQHQTNDVNNNGLQLSPIDINQDYRIKWNIHENDFVCLTKKGELISNSLYRVGGFGVKIKEDYFLLLKHVEAFYSDSITKDAKRKPHLASIWCILDKNGNEKVEFEEFKSPYIVKDSQIYSVDRKYYNIESGEFYCYAHSVIQSNEFIFLENSFDDNKSKRGVMKINKKDGTWELFP